MTPKDRSNDEDAKRNIGLKSAIAGGITGVTQTVFSYPLEYIKTQVQLDEKGHSKLYDGSWDCVKKTFRDYGVLGLYRGMAILVYSCIPKLALRFFLFEYLRKEFEDTTGQLSSGMKVINGLTVGSIEALLIVTPVEAIKVKFINDKRSRMPLYRGFFHGISIISRTEGFRGFYQALIPTLLKEGTNQGLRFFVVESLKDVYRGSDHSQPVPMGWTGIFGASAGAISALSNNPLDVIKTRMQGLEAARYRNTWDCAQKIWRNEGLGAFYNGVLLRMSRVSIDVAVTFIVYDKIMAEFQKVF